MAFYNKSGQIIEVGNPELNADLVSGATPLKAMNYSDARREIGVSVSASESASEPTILSSLGARNKTLENQTKLTQAESSLEETRKILAKGNELGARASETTGIQFNPIANVSGNLATGYMVNNLNSTLSKGGLTSDEQEGLNSLKQAEGDVLSSLSNARSASNNPTDLNFWMKRYEDKTKKYDSTIQDYFNSTKSLRERQVSLLSPTTREQELNKQVLDLRSQADQFSLQTEKEKMSEFEGQTLGFAQGRASEIDFKASFKNKEMALKEKNLLSELGLEQKKREYEGKTVEQQLDDFRDDFDLRSKIEDKLIAQEDKLLEKANSLSKDSQTTLLKLMDELEGFSADDLPEEARKKLEELSVEANLPFDLVQSALKAQKQRRVFDDSLKLAQKERLSEKGGIKITPEDQRSLIGAGFLPNDITNIQNDVNTHGIDAVIDNLKKQGKSEQQINTVLKTYGQTPKLTLEKIKSATTQKDASDGLKARYTEDELQALAKEHGFAGFFTTRAKEVENFLNSEKAKEVYIQLFYEQEKAAGKAE
mgnify:CR=1 FL=1